jgi:two-component system LytT family response regulator
MNLPMHILIVDDERPAREKLRRLLAEHCPNAQLHEARDGLDALQQLENAKFDLMFLDIHMPELDGIQTAQQLAGWSEQSHCIANPEIVFVTAYDQFALQAFDANAIDYLLKPFDEERFLRALRKVEAQRAITLRDKTESPLLISDRGVVKVVAITDIHWLETADNYVLIHTAESQHIMRQTLVAMAQRLGKSFARCHRRYLIRLDQIVEYAANAKGDGDFVLRSGTRVPCSRQYRDEVLQRIV